jgi:hypothetical protein
MRRAASDETQVDGHRRSRCGWKLQVVLARLEEEPHVNPSTGTLEFSLRDPDGYYVTISAL